MWLCWELSKLLYVMEHHFSLQSAWRRYSALNIRLMFSQKWIKGAYCHEENNWYFFTNDKVWDLKQKLRFWKMWNCHCELDSFPIFKDFYDEIEGDINEYKCWHLKDLHNSENQYFPNNNVWCYKTTCGLKTYSNCKLNQMILM